MCLGVPSKVISVEDGSAVVDVLGARRTISLLLIEDEIKIGDYVLVHAGFAIQKMQHEDAVETLDLFKQIAEAEDKSE